MGTFTFLTEIRTPVAAVNRIIIFGMQRHHLPVLMVV